MATLQKPKRAVRRSGKKATAKHPIRKGASNSRTNGSARSRMASRRPPETLRLRSLSPSYTVNDLQKSIAWYRDGLGFVVSEQWEEGGKLMGVMLKAGSCTFGLS